MKKKKICAFCGREYIQTRKDRKIHFCSAKCSNANRVKNAVWTNKVKKCIHCGKEYRLRDTVNKTIAAFKKQKYCCQACFLEANDGRPRKNWGGYQPRKKSRGFIEKYDRCYCVKCRKLLPINHISAYCTKCEVETIQKI